MSNNIPAEFQARIDQLEQWKREATAILDPILEYGRKHPDIKLGASITDFVIERCKQYDELKAENTRLVEELRESRNSVKSLRYSLDQRTAQYDAVKEENERLKADKDLLEQGLYQHKEVNAALKAKGQRVADCLTAVRLPNNPYIVLDSELAEDIDSALKEWQNKEGNV